jgi:hypothetical protein
VNFASSEPSFGGALARLIDAAILQALFAPRPVDVPSRVHNADQLTNLTSERDPEAALEGFRLPEVAELLGCAFQRAGIVCLRSLAQPWRFWEELTAELPPAS